MTLSRVVLLVGVLALVGVMVQGKVVAQDNIPLLINELLASNDSAVQDPQGDYDDWVELVNVSDDAFDAAGLYLTDDVGEPTKWQIPTNRPSETTVPGRGYFLIWLDGDVSDAGLHGSFKLSAAGEAVALFAPDGVTLVDHVSFGVQVSDISYGRYPNAGLSWHQLVQPTPGSINKEVYLGDVGEVKFSHARGFYEESFYLSLSCETPDAQIVYTFDGSEPYVPEGSGIERHDRTGEPLITGMDYTGPILITGTSCVRVAAIKSGYRPTKIEAQTYLFLDQVIHQPARPAGWPTNWGYTGQGDYEMDPEVVNDPCYAGTIKEDLKSVPTLSLVTDWNNWFGGNGQGIYLRGELQERPVSAELLFPDQEPGFQINCAVMIVGGSSTDRWKMDKLSMRLKFQNEFGPGKLRYPVFGDEATNEFDTLVVDARMNNSWGYGGGVIVNRDGERLTQRDTAQYTRDQFIADIQNRMGGYGPHGRHVHLYLNGLYWGLYWLHERPDDHFAAAYLGGQSEDYGSADTHRGGGPLPDPFG